MRKVKRMRFTAADVHSMQLRTVHEIHKAALLQASQATTEDMFRNIVRPMPRTCLSADITQYMSCCPPAGERHVPRCPTSEQDPAASQPASKRARPGKRTALGARKSEQRPAQLQLNTVQARRQRRRKQENQHRREIVATPQKTRRKTRLAENSAPPQVLTRQERASLVYKWQNSVLPDVAGAKRRLSSDCSDASDRKGVWPDLLAKGNIAVICVARLCKIGV